MGPNGPVALGSGFGCCSTVSAGAGGSLPSSSAPYVELVLAVVTLNLSDMAALPGTGAPLKHTGEAASQRGVLRVVGE